MDKKSLRIGVIGDYDGRASHLATNEAIRHCAAHANIKAETIWIATDSLDIAVKQNLIGFDALWCAPGSPYKSAQGAMNAIQYAREKDLPFLGTCGGFQHAVLEFARDMLNLEDVKRADFDPYSPNAYISGLSCSLIGETRRIYIAKGTKSAEIYSTGETDEQYNCNFGLNADFLEQLTAHGFVAAGSDEAGDTRILELPQKRFFVATLFQPQLSSTPEKPHKLILAFLESAVTGID